MLSPRHLAEAGRDEAATSIPALFPPSLKGQNMSIYLATDQADAKADGNKVILTIPSGETSLQVSLDIHQATMLAQRTMREVRDFLSETARRPLPACAQIIAFRARMAGGAA